MRSPRVPSVLLLSGAALSLALGCAPNPGVARSAESTDALGASADGGATAAVPDASAPAACSHDTKELGPCVADCDRGLASACTVLASRVEHGDGAPRDLTRVLSLHERACELRDAASCATAARMHGSGSGVPPSRVKQVEFLAAACKLGDATSCAIAARAFTSGAGVPQDPRRATELWQRACAAGLSDACDALEQPPSP